ncbi:MAG TPA: ribonuclease Z [Saprospiraceae bacterium]|nr:ribonuclease Z [Saprospiraceae bacterium]
MNIRLTILGSSSAVPTATRNTSAQFLQFLHFSLLIDCGESSIHRMIRLGLPYDKIEYIFISHLHTDHILGLPGLLSSYALKNRVKPLTIFSPQGLKELMEPLIGPTESLPYSLNWVTIDPEKSMVILDQELFTVETIPLLHRVPTSGYLFREKRRPPNIKKEAISKYQLSIAQIKAAKKGLPVQDANGQVIDNQDLVIESPAPRSYAYCSDTMYSETVAERVKGVDLLYHEATYLDELRDLAQARGHATSLQAAQIAQQAKVGKLLLGHFSTRYKDAKILEQEAQTVFPNTVAVGDGDCFGI